VTEKSRDVHHRLEPRPPARPLEEGFAAPLADPLWFLGRQWQLGEHAGANAASPVEVAITRSQTPITTTGQDRTPRPHDTPQTTPPEALLEGETDEWWTIGRRVRIGRAASAQLPAAADVQAAIDKRDHGQPLTPAEQALLKYGPFLIDLSVPYDALSGTAYDGLALYAARGRAPIQGNVPAAAFSDVPHRPTHWEPPGLDYADDFGAGNAVLTARRHDGGDVDWWTVDATQELRPPTPTAGPVRQWPSRFRYPGSPAPRWWQIEDAAVDVGGYPPDRAHFATLLLIDLLTTHSDDWFTFHLRSSAGQVVTLHRLAVRDTFDEVHTINLAPSGPGGPGKPAPPADWSLFAVEGLGEWALPLWPTAASPLAGEPLEEVVLGIDEDANLLWAVEQRVDGQAFTFDDTGAADRGSAPKNAYAYRPSSYVPKHWHPYTLEVENGARHFRQARLADLTQPTTSPKALRPLPSGRLLTEPAPGETVPRIQPAAVPSTGLRIIRRAMLARRTDGTPVLWVQRQRVPLLVPPSNALRFDIVLGPDLTA
jgi:hypothetical protein